MERNMACFVYDRDAKNPRYDIFQLPVHDSPLAKLDGELVLEHTILPDSIQPNEVSRTILPDRMQRKELSRITISEGEPPLQGSSHLVDCTRKDALDFNNSEVRILQQALAGALCPTSGVEACSLSSKGLQTDCQGTLGIGLQDSTPLEYTLSTEASLTVKTFTDTLEACPEESSVHLGVKLPCTSKFETLNVPEKSGIDMTTSAALASDAISQISGMDRASAKRESAPHAVEPTSVLLNSETLYTQTHVRDVPATHSVDAKHTDDQSVSSEAVAITPPQTPQNVSVIGEALPAVVEQGKTKKSSCRRCCTIM
jgi:hypothetical protein